MAGERESFFRMCLLWPTLFLYPDPLSIILITEHSKSFISRWHTNSCSKDTASKDSVMTMLSNLDITPFSFFPISCTDYVHLVFCFSFLKKMIFLQDGSLLMMKVFVLRMFSCKYEWLFFIHEIYILNMQATKERKDIKVFGEGR